MDSIWLCNMITEGLTGLFGFYSIKLVLDTHGRVINFMQGVGQTVYYLPSVTPVELSVCIAFGRNKWTEHQ